MLESEINEIKKLLDEKRYDDIYMHIQSVRVSIDIMRTKLDNLIKH